MGEMTIKAELGRGFQHRVLVAAGRLANHEHGAKAMFSIALLLALQEAPDGGAIVLQTKGLARGQDVKGQGGLGDVKRDHMIETGGGRGHHGSVHPGVLDCMRPFKVSLPFGWPGESGADPRSQTIARSYPGYGRRYRKTASHFSGRTLAQFLQHDIKHARGE